MEQLLKQIRKVNTIFEKKGAAGFAYNDVCEILSNLMKSNTYILSAKGKVLGVFYVNEEDSSAFYDDESNSEMFLRGENESILEIEETKSNVIGDEALAMFPDSLTKTAYNKYHTIVPIYGGGQRLGTLIFSRYDSAYSVRDVILMEHVATIVGIEIERRRNKRQEEKKRRRTAAQVALDGLTWSEIQSLYYVFKELENGNDLVVASKIAQRENITRSIIVNALKKIESAGIVETRSFGQKGTKVRLLNDFFPEELERRHI